VTILETTASDDVDSIVVSEHQCEPFNYEAIPGKRIQREIRLSSAKSKQPIRIELVV
jgi:hypothetical protein